MLHVDLWWKGQNIAVDPGTYSYNAPKPWNNPLAATPFHNTLTVDGADQMERYGKFLWFPWLKGKVVRDVQTDSDNLLYWQGEHDGYCRWRDPVRHQRVIIRILKEFWLVLDRPIGEGEHHYMLHWLFFDFDYVWNKKGHLVMRTPKGPYYVKLGSFPSIGGFSLARAVPGSPRGWHSPQYYVREPALSLDLQTKARKILFWTFLGPKECAVKIDRRRITITAPDWYAKVQLRSTEEKIVAKSISLSGPVSEHLAVAA
jgi:asparagine synthase (glutamine-hydrolysing)